MKDRLDKIMVLKGLAASRERARALILAGQVVVDDHRVDKVGTRISDSAIVRLKGQDIPFVSRGGLKLQKALHAFKVEVNNIVALDVGASTGGFTDCLLQNGAKKVYAVDVGYGQLAWKLREDPRVVNMERCNIKYLTTDCFDNDPPALAVIDASFISLAKVLPNTLNLLLPHGHVVALIKPQFEVGKGMVGKGGIVKERSLHNKAIEQVKQVAENLHCRVMGVIDSPIQGTKGNQEFLIYLIKNC